MLHPSSPLTIAPVSPHNTNTNTDTDTNSECAAEERVGYWGGKDDTWLFLVPPALRSRLPFLSDPRWETLPEGFSDEGMLYGVVLSNKTGAHAQAAQALLAAAEQEAQRAQRESEIEREAAVANSEQEAAAAAAAAASAASAAAAAAAAAAAPVASVAASAAAAAAAAFAAEEEGLDMALVHKTAGFVASKGGLGSLPLLQSKPNSRSVMPFLFEDGKGHSVFLRVLDALVKDKK